MSLQLPWLQLDVFSDRLFAGNPLAVVLDAGALDAVQMQRVARWTNLSETAFCPADGVPDDPVTGSANAAIAAYLQATGGLGLYCRQWRASQGREVGRDGYLEVRVDGDSGAISVGGACCIGVRGMLRLDAAS